MTSALRMSRLGVEVATAYHCYGVLVPPWHIVDEPLILAASFPFPSAFVLCSDCVRTTLSF